MDIAPPTGALPTVLLTGWEHREDARRGIFTQSTKTLRMQSRGSRRKGAN